MADWRIWSGVTFDFGLKLWFSFTVLLVFSAHVFKMVFVASKRRESEVLLELAGDDHTCCILRSSGTTRFSYFSIPESDQITLDRWFTTLGAKANPEFGS